MNDKFEHACEFCKRKFETKRGVNFHHTSCIYAYAVTEERFVIEEILTVFEKKGGTVVFDKVGGSRRAGVTARPIRVCRNKLLSTLPVVCLSFNDALLCSHLT